MATFKPFVSTDKFSMQTFNDKFEEVITDFNADNLKIDTALNQKGNCRIVTGSYTGTGESGDLT